MVYARPFEINPPYYSMCKGIEVTLSNKTFKDLLLGGLKEHYENVYLLPHYNKKSRSMEGWWIHDADCIRHTPREEVEADVETAPPSDDVAMNNAKDSSASVPSKSGPTTSPDTSEQFMAIMKELKSFSARQDNLEEEIRLLKSREDERALE